MNRVLTTRLRKLETKAGLDGDFQSICEARARRMSDDELFAHSRAVSEALVAHHGGVDQAAAALLEEDGAKSVDFLLLALNSASADEFMGRNSGWDAYKRQGRSAGV